MEIFLGRETEGEAEVQLPGEVFLRHAVCLGASGSGKTVACKVICEEFLLQEIPVIALDPQGDIASMILPGDLAQIEAKGLDPAVAESFHDKVEVVIWTPGSHAGVPLCLDPLMLEGLPERKSDRVRVLSAIASNLTALLGYSLDSNDGQFASAYLDLALQHLSRNKIKVQDLSGFAAFLDDLPEALLEEANRVIKESKREEIGRKIQVLGIGARKLLFQMGAPVDINNLLGLDEPDTTRLSVIYLNTLHAQEEKEFFVSQVVQRLYDWMLNNPASVPQALFYIDEIAPFIPPVRKPACKDILKMLFKQARKYGVSCLIASQNPGDIDYTALAQFSTWALGRMMVRQDIKKVEKMIRSLAPSEVDATVEKLPALEPGQFLLLSPDVYDRVVSMRVRWLLTRHETLDEDRVEDLISDEMRERLSRRGAPEDDELLEEPEAEASEPEDTSTTKEAKDTPALTPRKRGELDLDLAFSGVEVEASATAVRARSDESQKPLQNDELIMAYLVEQPGAYTVKELTGALSVSASLVRKYLKLLSEDGKVANAKVGRSQFYWRKGDRFAPAADIVRPIHALAFRVTPEDARKQAEKLAEGGFLGMFKRETVEGPKESYLLLWQVTVTFQKTSGIAFLKSTEKIQRKLCYDAKTARLLVLDERQPLELVDNTHLVPEQMIELSTLSKLTPHTPAELGLRTQTLQACKASKAIVDECRTMFGFAAEQPQLVAMPYWDFTLRSDGKTREVLVDGLYGRAFALPKR